MKAKRKNVALGILLSVIAVVAFSAYNYLYQDHRDIAKERIDFDIQTTQLKSAMEDTNTSLQFVDKVIQTKGKVTSQDQQSVILDNSIQVNFNPEVNFTSQMEKTLTIKGRCVGYDDLLELVKIDQATIIDN
ncbi:hypothetical protein ACFQ1M_05060 [Sungkyunkwania multivorans]|uniref:tRNA_anti-like n=1 Tax=Sungkyunkwania multivorans TaxID=1173618 RepID=A0ABW3CVM7_9FLAO